MTIHLGSCRRGFSRAGSIDAATRKRRMPRG
jgi:hypothetical protein